jgi:hypothetical protein
LPGRKSGTAAAAADDDDNNNKCSETKKFNVKNEWEHFGCK